MTHEQRRRLAVKRIIRVWVTQELGKEHLKDVDELYTRTANI